jgi:hypothetical protein
MSISGRSVARALSAAALVISSACQDVPTAPDSDGTAMKLADSEAGFVVVPLQLRAVEGSESSMWGSVVVFVGTLAPPNPCGETLQLATVALCGILHNPDGELLTGGALRVQTRVDATPLVLELTVPPNPCLTYQVQAVASPDLSLAGLTLPAVQVVFSSEQGEIVSVQATPGPPNDPSLDLDGTPGPPDAPPNPCLITFDVRAG